MEKKVDFYDLTAPGVERTGEEKPVSELMRPDERIRLFNNYSVEDHQATLIHIKRTLSPHISEEINKRLETVKNLAIYGYFQWEFLTVSLFWSLTTIEMALKLKFVEIHKKMFNLKKDNERRTINSSFECLEKYLKKGWKIEGAEYLKFNGSFNSLLVWAQTGNMLPSDTPVVLQELTHLYNNKSVSNKQVKTEQAVPLDVLVAAMPRLRNITAHPASYNITLTVRSAVDGYAQAVEIINRLWP